MQKIFFAFLSLVFVLTACKEKTVPDMPPRKRACLHFINLNPDYAAIDVQINSFETSGNLIDGLAYLDTWPHNGYASLLSLQQKDSERDTSWISYRIVEHTTGTEILPLEELRLYEDKAATLILAKDATGSPIIIKTLDSFDEETDSTGNVRVMNFDESLLSLSMFGYQDTIRTDSVKNLGPLNYTGYRSVTTGKKDFYLINNSVPDTIDVFRNKEIRLHRNYCIYVMYNTLTNKRMAFWEEMAKCVE